MALIVVVNGKGGVGKDSFCDAVASESASVVKHISSITPIKNLARQAGWLGGKELKDRKFLSDLKALLCDYNNYPTMYCVEESRRFEVENRDGILFIDIREPEEIKKFVEATNHKAITLLIKRDEVDKNVYGNASDDNVNNYDYDYVYYNNTGLDELPQSAIAFMNEVKECEQKKVLPHDFGC